MQQNPVDRSCVTPSLTRALPGYHVCIFRHTHAKNNYMKALSSHYIGMRSHKSDFGISLLLQAEEHNSHCSSQQNPAHVADPLPHTPLLCGCTESLRSQASQYLKYSFRPLRLSQNTQGDRSFAAPPPLSQRWYYRRRQIQGPPGSSGTCPFCTGQGLQRGLSGNSLCQQSSFPSARHLWG